MRDIPFGPGRSDSGDSGVRVPGEGLLARAISRFPLPLAILSIESPVGEEKTLLRLLAASESFACLLVFEENPFRARGGGGPFYDVRDEDVAEAVHIAAITRETVRLSLSEPIEDRSYDLVGHSLSEAVVELTLLETTLYRRGERRLLAEVERSGGLARELQHRVGNNLQLVQSLVAIQMREATSAEIEGAFALLERRVGILAFVNALNLDSGRPGCLELGDLVSGLGTLVSASEEWKALPQLSVSAEAGIRLPADEAAYLAMAFGEVLSAFAGASRSPRKPGSKPRISVRCTAADGEAVILFSAPAAPVQGAGAVLAAAVAGLGGTLGQDSDDSATRIRLSMPLRRPLGAEAGQQPAAG